MISVNLAYGCKRVSPGCDNCYIARYPFAYHTKRFGLKTPFEGEVGYFDYARQTKKVEHQPKNSVIFVNALTDTFGNFIPDSKRDEWHDFFRSHPEYQFMLLTKRPGKMMTYYKTRSVPDNVWLGTTVESSRFIPRIKLLKAIEANVRWVCFEPLLEDIGEIDLQGVHLISVGGESGPHARSFDPEWARNLLRVARAQGVAYSYLGARGFSDDKLDGVAYDEMPATMKLA